MFFNTLKINYVLNQSIQIIKLFIMRLGVLQQPDPTACSSYFERDHFI